MRDELMLGVEALIANLKKGTINRAVLLFIFYFLSGFYAVISYTCLSFPLNFPIFPVKCLCTCNKERK